MSAGNYIGYFAHLVDKGMMTREEADRKLEELHRIDMKHDEIDRLTATWLHSGSVLTKEQTDILFECAKAPMGKEDWEKFPMEFLGDPITALIKPRGWYGRTEGKG